MILLSVLFRKRSIFSLCFQTINAAINALGIKNAACENNSKNIGAKTTDTNDASEEYRNVTATTPQTNAIKIPQMNDKPSVAPIAVATPLPPLNPKNTGKICPITAASATNHNTKGGR